VTVEINVVERGDLVSGCLIEGKRENERCRMKAASM
jgi:hypothetical protein